MGFGHSLRPALRALVISVTALAMVLALPTAGFAQAVAEGTVTDDFGQWPSGPNTIDVGGDALECFTLSFTGQLPALGTVYTIDDHDVTLSEFDESVVAVVIGSRNYTFDEGSLLATMAANGDLDDIIQLTIWTYTDNYDLAVASDDERDAVAELQALVDATFEVDADGPLTAAEVVYAAAPNPALARLAVLPPDSVTPTTTRPTTAPELGPAVTTIDPEATVPATAATTPATTATTSGSSTTGSSTTAAPTTTGATTTEAPTTTAPSTTTSSTTAPSTTTPTTSTESSGSVSTETPDPTVMAAVQVNPGADEGSDSSNTLWAGVGVLLAGAVVALFAARRSLAPKA